MFIKFCLNYSKTIFAFFIFNIKTDFVGLIARQYFTWQSNTFDLEKHCKQYQQKCFFFYEVLLY